MSAMDFFHLERREAALQLLNSLIRLNRRRLLSPVCEAYITDIWLPDQHHRWADIQDDVVGVGLTMEEQDGLRRSVKTHPFNFSDEQVNVARARNFLRLLKRLREGLVRRRESVSDAWWPQDVAALISALKAERADKDGGETREEERSAIQEEGSTLPFGEQQGLQGTTAGQAAGSEESEERA